MDQDKTTVMGGYGSAQAGGSADATRVVSNPAMLPRCDAGVRRTHTSYGL